MDVFLLKGRHGRSQERIRKRGMPADTSRGFERLVSYEAPTRRM